MPNNWKTYKLGEISTDVSYGYTESSTMEEIGPKFLRITDIQKDYVSWETVPYCPINKKDLVKYRLEIGDIVIARTGNSTGETILIKDNVEAVFASYLIRFKIDNAIANPSYVSYVLRSRFWKGFVNGVKSGSAQPGANAKQFSGFELKIPPLPEQRAIASILSTIDDQIENNLAMNKTLEEMAMALYKHWFVDFGPFQKGNFVESELGEIPEGWEVKELKDVAKVNQRSLKKDHSFNEINYIDISSVGTGLVENNNIIESGKAPSRAKRLLNDGDIVWSTVRPTRRSYFLALGYAENTVVSTGFAVISPVKVPYSYLYPLTCTQEFVDYLDSRSTGAAYPAVTGKVFEQARIIVPSKKSLDEYSEIVSNYYRKISANLEENQTLIAQRDALLPKLVSGEVRVKGFED